MPTQTCELTDKKCVPCEGGVPKMIRAEARAMMQQIPGWELAEDANSIRRRFEFKGFYKCMAFINAMAWVANSENHRKTAPVTGFFWTSFYFVKKNWTSFPGPLQALVLQIYNSACQLDILVKIMSRILSSQNGQETAPRRDLP